MNKLLVDNIDALGNVVIDKDTDLVIHLNKTNGSINIKVRDYVCLNVIAFCEGTHNTVHYELGDNSKLIVKHMGIDNGDQVIVDLNGDYASTFFHSRMINYQNNCYIQSIRHNASHTESRLTNHAINKGSCDFIFDVEVIVPIDSNDCITNQDNKIINQGTGKNEIKPNLLIENYLIEANHAAYIGKFDQEKVFYLLTRGIPMKEVEKLLSVGFLLEQMDLEESEKEQAVQFIEKNI